MPAGIAWTSAPIEKKKKMKRKRKKGRKRKKENIKGKRKGEVHGDP